MTGTKVEAIHHHGVQRLEKFVVGRVLSRRAASRCRPAERVHGRLVGARSRARDDRLRSAERRRGPDGRGRAARRGDAGRDARSKRAKLRGVVSEGMILARPSLRSSSSDGIRSSTALAPRPTVLLRLTRPGRRPFHRCRLVPGARRWPTCCRSPIEVIELEVTPNRPDCLGVYGVARELHAATGARSHPSRGVRIPGSRGARSRAPRSQVECPDLCPRFTARVFEHVTIAPSPPWLAARLIAAGQRPINNVVDITNYAMLLTGQPLHAFDLDRVAGARLTVSSARARASRCRRSTARRGAGRGDGRDRGRRGSDIDRRA